MGDKLITVMHNALVRGKHNSMGRRRKAAGMKGRYFRECMFGGCKETQTHESCSSRDDEDGILMCARRYSDGR